jgi:hypothetical protein
VNSPASLPEHEISAGLRTLAGYEAAKRVTALRMGSLAVNLLVFGYRLMLLRRRPRSEASAATSSTQG